MTAKEIAEKFAGATVTCRVIKSSAVSGVGDTYTARIIGWKSATPKDAGEYVAVEVLPPGQTKYLLKNLGSGYHWTVKNLNAGAYGKKVYPEEITLPTDYKPVTRTISTQPKKINEWPHVCKDCGSPAQVFMAKIDCSNKGCKNKYRTSSGMDLFLPKEMQIALSKPKPSARPELNKDGYLICHTCKQYLVVTPGSNLWASPGVLNMVCEPSYPQPRGAGPKHPWKVKLAVGDKMKDHTGRTTTYDGKRFI